jgi:hypothetical protein
LQPFAGYGRLSLTAPKVRGVDAMADTFHQVQNAQASDRPQERSGSGRLVLLAIALAFACVGLAFSSSLLIAAVVPALISVVALLAAFRVMG